jgi:hypothetical protein
VILEHKWGFGLTGTVSLNQRKQKFERDSTIGDGAYNMAAIGVSYIHGLYQNKNHDLNLQADLCFLPGESRQNVPTGASIGVLLNYAYHKRLYYKEMDLGGGDFEVVVADAINFHVGVHGVLTGSQMEGSGLMFDAGISHRFSNYFKEDTPEQKAAQKEYAEKHKPAPYVYIPEPKPFVPKYEDFEYIEKDVTWSTRVGMVSDVSLGDLSNAYGIGVGGNIGVSYVGKNGWGGGFDMSFLENQLKIPLRMSNYFQNTNTFNGLIGATVQKTIIETDRNYFTAQVGIYGIKQSTGIRLKQKDTISYIQDTGFSSAFRLNYGIQLGKKSIEDWNIATIKPSVFVNYLNIHTAVRYIALRSEPIPNGFQIEIGASYQFNMTTMKSYQWKVD